MYIPYYPTKFEAVKTLGKILSLPPNTKFIDLGSGGGRILYELSRKYDDIEVFGVEKDPRLVQASRHYLLKRGFKPRILSGDLFKIDLNMFDIAYAYLTPDALAYLQPRIRRFIDDDKLFITFDFRVPMLNPARIIKIRSLAGSHNLYIYGKRRILNKFINY